MILYIYSMTLVTIKIELIKNYFKTRSVLKAYLIESYAKGIAYSKSDLDILVDYNFCPVGVFACIVF